ncbi:MAG TPA: DUF4214 domain-containing protein [Pirellulales bacterium]|nr:DUF4214 domain-containing protein [Pirellulales bacterium]
MKLCARFSQQRPRRWNVERLEGRDLLTALSLTSVSETSPTTLKLDYTITGGALPAPVEVGVYRSTDGAFTAAALRGSDETIADVTLTGNDDGGASALAAGSHTTTITLPTALGIDAEHPFVYAVVDPASQELPSQGLAGRSDFFHKYVLGVVTHGYLFSLVPGASTMPAWVPEMANDLEQVDHYQKAIPFDWAALSSLAQPGETAVARGLMATAIDKAVAQLATEPTDVVDLHLIGFSRGGVVVSQALQDLLDSSGQAPAALLAGYEKVTLLDPHPAQPTLDAPNGQPIAQWYSPASTPLLSAFAVHELDAFQAAADDPPVVIPSCVNKVEVYYQHTASSQLSVTQDSPDEPLLFNLWGQVPVDAPNASYYDLTGPGLGHEETHAWYLNNVVLTGALDAGGPNPGVHVSPGNANAAYVEQVFQDVLGRPADSGGLTWWVSQLDAGAPRASVATAIDHTSEYFATDVIVPGYEKFLGRSPDSSGLSVWTGALAAGMTDVQFEAQLAASPEYYARAGGNNTAWIDALYAAFLGRPADTQGVSYWVDQLSAGKTRANVADALAASHEGLSQQVVDDYERYLDRSADPAGLAYWVGQLQFGKTNEDVLTSFIASSEYFQQHTGQSG